jgi:hypothetical protein
VADPRVSSTRLQRKATAGESADETAPFGAAGNRNVADYRDRRELLEAYSTSSAAAARTSTAGRDTATAAAAATTTAASASSASEAVDGG